MFFFRSGDFNLPGSSLKSTSDICLRRLLPKRTTAFHRLSGVPGRAAILSTACLLALAASAMQAQQSNGLTFYHLAGPATTDAGGNTITSIKPGPQTDGVHVAFESGSATTACDSAASLYTVPITGGSVATLMGPSLRAESAEPAGTSTVLCSHLVLSGSTLFYPADYTPTGGSLRSGIFKLPIAGGASADVLATGDMTPLENFQTSGGTRVTQPGTVNSVATTTFSADPSANLIANYTASFTAGGPYSFNTVNLYGYPPLLGGPGLPSVAACPGVTVPLEGGMVSSGLTVGMESGYEENAPWYADIVDGTGTNYAGANTGMQFIRIAVWPYAGCDSVVFGPDLGSLTGGTTFILPGEPLPDTPAAVSTMAMGAVAISNGVVYLSATQLLSPAQGSYSGIFTVADPFTGATGSSGVFPLPNGTWTPSQNPIPTKVISNYDPVPGITLGVASCPGGVSQLPAIGSYFTESGNYLVFAEVQQLQNCATMAISYAGGIYAYNLITKAVQLVAPYGASLVSGDPAVVALNAILPGSLSADGHLALVLGTAAAGSSTVSPVLYSAYLPQIVTAVSLTAPSASSYGSGVTLTAKVSPSTGAASTATGSVKFLDGSTVLGTQSIDSTGTAAIRTSALSSGAHSFQALYAGDTLYEGAGSATAALTITKATPTLTLHSSATTAGIGQAVILTAQASGAVGYPTGQIAFSSGTTSLGTATLNATGAATLTLTSLPAGTSQIVATYAGDANFNGATSTAITISIGTPDYSITASPTSATITAGQSASFVFTVTPVFGFSSPVTFSCGGLPSEASCSFAPATVSPGSGAVSSTLTITTTAPTISRNVPPTGSPAFTRTGGGFAGVCFAVLLGWLPKRLRQRRKWMLIALACVFSAGMLSGCGLVKDAINQHTDQGTAKGTSTVTVSTSAGGGSAGANHTAAITVVIQ